jgi:lipopolysaccharide biosynthesis protein/2-polyprenyl-3-methyl-5-hydroxy-6-metoxy-1,4-benzoquinol methylase
MKYQNYSRSIIDDQEESLSKIVALIRSGSTVLDVGCSTGMLGKYLSEKKQCIVDGVDIDYDALEKCGSAYRKTERKDLESESLLHCFDLESYDFIICADVIEHLKSPDKLISELSSLLCSDGTMIISIPNITYVGVAIELLNGNFGYRKNGILDATHLRFYSKQSMIEVINDRGLHVWDINCVEKQIDSTEFGGIKSRLFPHELINSIVQYRNDAYVYQWIFLVKKFDSKAEIEYFPKRLGVEVKLPFLAQLYWGDRSNWEFNDEDKITGALESEHEESLEISFEFKQTFKTSDVILRIDPISEDRQHWVKSALIKNQLNEVIWTWASCDLAGDILNAKWLDFPGLPGKIIIPKNNDPQWYPELPKDVINQIGPGFKFLLTLVIDQQKINHAISLLDVDAANCSTLGDQLSQLVTVISEKDSQIDSLETNILNLNARVSELASYNESLRGSIEEMQSSRSWKITAPLRVFGVFIRKTFGAWQYFQKIYRTNGGFNRLVGKCIWIYRREGIRGFRERLKLLLDVNRPMSRLNVGRNSSKNTWWIIPRYIDPSLVPSDIVLDGDPAIAVHLHLFYGEMADLFISYFQNIPVKFDLYVSVPENFKKNEIASKFASSLPNLGSIVIECTPNRGRDIAPMIVQFGSRLLKYEYFAHFHTKKSPHQKALKDWGSDILDALLGPPGSQLGYVAQIIKLLQVNAKVIFPEGASAYIKDLSGWGANYEICRDVLDRCMGVNIEEFPKTIFPEGAMFWARTDALKDFLELPFTFESFEEEPLPSDGSLAHGLERILLISAFKSKGEFVCIHRRDSVKSYLHYEEQQDYSELIIRNNVKVLSYYLPQFHPIPENDLWHGNGFTEWTKVRSSNPLFLGHYQQHIPHADIGYYLLDSPDVFRTQADQMKKSGVSGQVFYHYWFAGKLILEDPARMLFENPDISMPYCFCWANENWTRRWDGNENEILLGQSYSARDASDFIEYLIPFFKDSRYLKIQDRPMLFVYRPSSIPNYNEYIDIWAAKCLENGVKAPYVIAVLTRGASDPRDFAMDGAVERVLHDWTGGAVPEMKNSLASYEAINGSVLSYDDVATFYESQSEKKEFDFFRSIVPIWDNTARYGPEAFLLHGSTPSRFQMWLEKSIDYTINNLPEDRRFLLVNAWNEWAEGAHLEPDTRYGYAYLNSVGRALSGIPYSDDLNRSTDLKKAIRLYFYIPHFVADKLKTDTILREKFNTCLLNQSILKNAIVNSNALEFFSATLIDGSISDENADIRIQFNQVIIFDGFFIEKLVSSALALRSIIIPNVYHGNESFATVSENGSVEADDLNAAPLLVYPGNIS